MTRHQDPLKHLRIASPCTADWEGMVGDERRRFCGQCELHVYNLSGLTRREAEDLITRAEGRLCLRFYRRADGTVLTRDCPVGLRAVRRRISRLATATLSTILGFFSGVGLNAAMTEITRPSVMGVVPVQEISNTGLRNPAREVGFSVMGGVSAEEESEPLMGDIVTPQEFRAVESKRQRR